VHLLTKEQKALAEAFTSDDVAAEDRRVAFKPGSVAPLLEVRAWVEPR